MRVRVGLAAALVFLLLLPVEGAEALSDASRDTRNRKNRPASQEQISNLLSRRYCGCPCGHKLMDCFGCSVAKADVSIALRALRNKKKILDVYLELNAPLVLVEWGDLASNTTRRLGLAVIRLRQEYGHRLKVVFRHASAHDEWRGRDRAQVLECSRQQGRYWEAYGWLMENESAGSQDEWEALALATGVLRKTFRDCLASGDFNAQFKKDMDARLDFRVKTIPAFFLNGRKLLEIHTYHDLKTALEDELRGISL